MRIVHATYHPELSQPRPYHDNIHQIGTGNQLELDFKGNRNRDIYILCIRHIHFSIRMPYLPSAVPISIRITTIAMIPSRMNVIVNDQDVDDTSNLIMKTNFIATKRSELKSTL